MCKGTFMIHSSAGGRDMALKAHRYPPPQYLPVPSVSATAIAMKNMHMDHESGSPYESSPRSVLESSEGLGSNRNRVGFALEFATPSKKKSSIKHEAAPPIALPLCHIKPTLLTPQEEEEEENGNSFLWPSLQEEEEEEEERERKGHICSIFSVGSPLLASTLDDDNDDDDELPPPLTGEILRECFLCKRSFADGKDIYIYRGEQAFCSEECRYHQILMDEVRRPSSSVLMNELAKQGGNFFL